MSQTGISYFAEAITFQIDQADSIAQWINLVVEQEQKSVESINFIFCSDEYLHKINLE